MIIGNDDQPLFMGEKKPIKETIINADLELARVNYQNATKAYYAAKRILDAKKHELKLIEDKLEEDVPYL